ncbi:MAG: hypothetical protein ACM3XM_02600, partial [Mycobacterium leprae]
MLDLTPSLDRVAAFLAPRLRSRTGRLNRRVAHVSSAGYAIRLYQALMPNIRAWLRDRSPLFPGDVDLERPGRVGV